GHTAGPGQPRRGRQGHPGRQPGWRPRPAVVPARRAGRPGLPRGARGPGPEARMTSYRRMRRQAHRVHRSGMQPMMLISSGDQFPEPAGVVILRLAWRYRSELAPSYLVGMIVGAGWWLHAARPHWWPFIVGLAVVAAAALVVFGAAIGLSVLME